jgi:hypothetical protein
MNCVRLAEGFPLYETVFQPLMVDYGQSPCAGFVNLIPAKAGDLLRNYIAVSLDTNLQGGDHSGVLARHTGSERPAHQFNELLEILS